MIETPLNATYIIEQFPLGTWVKRTMAKLNADMKDAFSKMKVFPFATASKEGTPNVIPLGIAELVDDETVWFCDNFMNKTLSNLRTNPKCAFYLWGPEIKGCFQCKGVAAIKNSGKDFDTMKAKLNVKNPALPARSLIIVKITEIFECKPGPTAGARIL
jgi:predicted pyridoxine 5'-phosphate oxidase superfamily flavin-nucleotide-binding protein